MRIMGIDPGLAVSGYGIIEWENDKARLLTNGDVATSSKDAFPDRLRYLSEGLGQVLTLYKPDEVALERPIYCQNIQIALTLGQVSGAIIMLAASRKLPVTEITPSEIKQAMVGHGRASKQQVKMMVTRLLNLDKPPENEHVSDALAVALCYAHGEKFRRMMPSPAKKSHRRRRR